MARKTSLRDFQEYLAGRLKTAAQGKGGASWLGIQTGDESWLVDLADSGEIIQAPQLAGVPLVRPWFAGIANIRGNLYAVSDFPCFAVARQRRKMPARACCWWGSSMVRMRHCW